jgi:hypothetical protein
MHDSLTDTERQRLLRDCRYVGENKKYLGDP